MTYDLIEHSMGEPLELNRAVSGGRVEMFAISDDEYPGGWFYRFQYYNPETGEILRYDNAHDDDELGSHHRHISFGEDSGIKFQNITTHVARFLLDVAHIGNEDMT